MPTKCFTKKTNSGKKYTACVDTKTFKGKKATTKKTKPKKTKPKKATRKKNKITIPKAYKLSSQDAIKSNPILRNLIGSYVMIDSQQRGSAVSALSGIVNREDMTEVRQFRNAANWLDNQDDTEMVRQFKYGVGSARGDFATSIFGNVRRQEREEDNFVGGFKEEDIGKRNVKRSKAQKKKDRMTSADKRNDEVNRNYTKNVRRRDKERGERDMAAYQKRTALARRKNVMAKKIQRTYKGTGMAFEGEMERARWAAARESSSYGYAGEDYSFQVGLNRGGRESWVPSRQPWHANVFNKSWK